MRTVRIKVYRFSELSEQVQNRLFNQRVKEMIEYEREEHYNNWPQFKKAIDKCERLQTPWFLQEYVWDYCGDAIMELLRSEDNEREYYKDGRVFSDDNL